MENHSRFLPWLLRGRGFYTANSTSNILLLNRTENSEFGTTISFPQKTPLILEICFNYQSNISKGNSVK